MTAGRSSHEVVEIVNGLKEGETVVLRAEVEHDRREAPPQRLRRRRGISPNSRPPRSSTPAKAVAAGSAADLEGLAAVAAVDSAAVVLVEIGHVVRAKARDVAVKAVAVAAAVILQLCHRSFDATGADAG